MINSLALIIKKDVKPSYYLKYGQKIKFYVMYDATTKITEGIIRDFVDMNMINFYVTREPMKSYKTHFFEVINV